jgi:hypothetical protein
LRTLLTVVFASTVLGVSATPVLGINPQRVEDLLLGIFEDVTGILRSFEGGPDDPRGPVQNSAILAQDSARLDAATRKANQLAIELQNLQAAKAQRDGR